MYWAINHQKTPTKRPEATGEDEHPIVTTTLYHLIAGLQECITAEHDDLLVAVVHHLVGTGRIKVLSKGCDRQWGADDPGTDNQVNASFGPAT
jgi:hypothetical protein